ncbi:unnamed protein product [Camellia sinensis]
MELQQTKEKKLLSRHFSHEHPLEHTSSPPKGDTAACFGCKLNIFSGKEYYKCKICPFSLHKVCHNMPKKVQHPADPEHHFTLRAMPHSSSTTASFNCKACGLCIIGFYYNCDKCGDYYHILCSVVPLFVKMPSHIHQLKLEFSPPYDFQCDLCKKPSYNGWLYRCGLCEFDAHLSCAITNKGTEWLQHQSAPQRYIALPINQNLDCNNKGHEIMELITQGMKGTGQNIRVEIGTDRSLPHDQYSLLSEDLTIPSYQFSDLCFSLDFAKSLLGDEYMDQKTKEAHCHGIDNIPEVKAKTSHDYAALPNGILDHLKHTNLAPTLAKKPNFDFHNEGPNPKNRLNGPFSTGIAGHAWMELGQESQNRKPNGARGRTDDTKSTKSDTESLGSYLSRLLLCFYYPRNNGIGSKSFKNGRK